MLLPLTRSRFNARDYTVTSLHSYYTVTSQSDDSAVDDEKGVDQDLQSQAVPENNESEPDEDENVLSEEGKELVKLLNEFETLDQSQTVDDSDLSSSGSSSDFEEKMEQSLKSSKAFRLLNDSQQKHHSSVQSQSHQSQQNKTKQIGKRNSTASSNASKRKRTAKKAHSNKPSSRGS
ncbi:hypothetical protein GJ496_009671 [Pomphorhynchus laevis]|nr:hypothetical protein GJ496_009671 [Pomphorhynchus laevis]